MNNVQNIIHSFTIHTYALWGIVIKLRPVVLNFEKIFEVSSRIKKGNSFVFCDSELFLLVEGIPESGSSLLIEGARTTGIALSVKEHFFSHFYILTLPSPLP